MKKLFAVLLAGVLVGSLVACGNKGGSGGSAATGEPIAEDTKAELQYTAWDTLQTDQNQATIDVFNKKYPNVKVTASYSTWNEYWTKLEAAATGGTLPDLITMHTNTIDKYQKNNFLADLTDLKTYDENFSYDNFPEGITKLYTFNDKIWGVPKDIDCIVLMYNPKLFADANLEVPTNDWTWDDVEAAAEKLTDKDKGIYGFAAPQDGQAGWYNPIYQNGGSVVNTENNTSGLDMPETIEAIEWWLNLYNNYSPTTAQFTESDANTMFMTGTIGMRYLGNWELGNYLGNDEFKDWDIVALPKGKQQATISNGLAMSVSAKSKNIDAAKQFCTVFGSKEGQEAAAIGPSIPCFNGISDVWAKGVEGKFNASAVLDQMEFGVQFVGTENKTVWDQKVNVEMDKIFNGEQTVEEGMKKAAKEMNDVLATEGK